MAQSEKEILEEMANENAHIRMWREFRNLLKGYKFFLILFVVAFPLFPKFVLGAPFKSFLPTYLTLLFTIFTVLFGIEWGVVENPKYWSSRVMASTKIDFEEKKHRIGYWKDHRARRNMYLLLAIIFMFLTVLSTVLKM